MGTPPNGGKRKVPAGPKAQPGGKGNGAASSRKQGKPTGIDPGGAFYGVKNTSSKNNKSAVTGANGNRNTPSGQYLLSSKAKRQVCE